LRGPRKNSSSKKQNKEEKVEIEGEGITNLLVGTSSDYLCASSISGFGESRSMEFAISSAARASASVALVGSSLEGLRAVEVLPPDTPRMKPLPPRMKNAFLQQQQ